MRTIRQLIYLFITFCSVHGYGQKVDELVQWNHTLNQVNDSVYELVFTAKIAPNWHIYSAYTDPDGSMPAEFTYRGIGTDFLLLGSLEEGPTVQQYSDVFEVTETYFVDELIWKQKIQSISGPLAVIKVDLFYQLCQEVCIPVDKTFEFYVGGKSSTASETTLSDRDRIMSEALVLPLKNKQLLESATTDSSGDQQGLWTIFTLGFLGGLIALLTPCVFPMIPLTVSYFTKQSGNRRQGIAQALWYGFFIVLIYGLLSVPFHVFASVDAQILNQMATNVWLNTAFFIVFVFFAISFFGYFELTLPSSWAHKMDDNSNKKGGIVGIFFMALTLAIVSFSCTGPILGGLLGSTALAEGSVAWNLTVGMLGFGVALALPFGLFALFPGMLQSLPKSGSWMTDVKVVLGFLELGLALKFLSNADLVGHWGLLKREVFLGIWALLAFLLAAYLFGLYRFQSYGPKGPRKPFKILLGALSFAFGVYLIAGLNQVVSLRALSGFPPPDFYTLSQEESDCPLGLDCYKDFEQGFQAAQKQGKPMLIDFTGWACVNCRKMEEGVWTDPEVYRYLNESVVLISLYVDDRQDLSEEDRFVFKFPNGRLKEINKVGQKWGTFQNINFNAVSQPFYVLMDTEYHLLQPPIQMADKKNYLEWLKKGTESNQP